MRSRLFLVSAVLLALAAPSVATAAPPRELQAVENDLKDGTLNACAYTSAQLAKALSQISPDLDQYAPNIRAAITRALGEQPTLCAKSKPKPNDPAAHPTPNAAPPSTGGGTPSASSHHSRSLSPAPHSRGGTTPRARRHRLAAGKAGTRTPAPPAVAPALDRTAGVSAGSGAGTPAPLVLLAILAGLFLLAGLVVAAARALGLAPAWAPAARHAWGEAGFRAGAHWGDFVDWLRRGH